MNKKITYSSYNCLNNIFNGWFGIETMACHDSHQRKPIEYKLIINGKEYSSSLMPLVTPSTSDENCVFWLNIQHNDVQGIDDLSCEIIYMGDAYVHARKSSQPKVQNIYEEIFRKLNAGMASLIQPRIFIHCWTEEVSIEVIRKAKQSLNPNKITLLKPYNIDEQCFKNIRRRAQFDFSLETEVLEVPAKGRDIGGFIAALKKCLDEKSLDYNPNRPCLFLHSKNTSNIPSHRVSMWRNSLIDPLISRFRGFVSLLLLWLFKPAIIYSKDIHREEPRSSLNIHQFRSLLLARMISKRLFNKSPDSFGYCAGTMMWVIPSKIAHIWTLSRLLEMEALLEPSETMSEPSHAHAFERLFPEMIRSAGGLCIRV